MGRTFVQRAGRSASVRRLALLTLLLAAAMAMAAAALGAGVDRAPTKIALPDGFQPEGIDIGPGGVFYVGSIPTGAIFRGSVVTGKGAVLVPGASGRAAVGVDERRHRLFVAGGSTGKGFVYDARTGALVREYRLASGSPTFVNDVVVTKDAAYFTDSYQQVLYRVTIARSGAPRASAQSIPLSGDIAHTTGLNANGIEATPNAKTLVIVQTNTGKVFTVDPGSGVTRTIAVNATLTNGDGLLLQGRTLYVVQNRDNRIAVVSLAANLRSGRVVRYVRSATFDVPTTIARRGNRLYAVNARFNTTPTPSTRYWVSVLRIR
jgi:sugar lactone lactonase YvrE